MSVDCVDGSPGGGVLDPAIGLSAARVDASDDDDDGRWAIDGVSGVAERNSLILL